jgi:predicted nucleic acid-binding Zn ribbon protein
MPADADPRAIRCSRLCTQRAAKGVAPPGDRKCRQCGIEIPVTVDARKAYCTSRCRLIAAERRRRRRG